MNEKIYDFAAVVIIAGVVYLIVKAICESYESIELVLMKDGGMGFRASRAPRLDEFSGDSLILQR
jgi:hypothetical protein